MNFSSAIFVLQILIVITNKVCTQITLNGIAALAHCQEKLILEGTTYEEKAISNCVKNFNAKYLQKDIELIENIYTIVDELSNKEFKMKKIALYNRGCKIDVKRYKSFRNYLKETSENLDNLLYLKLEKNYNKFKEIKLSIEDKIKHYNLITGRLNDEFNFWWIKPNSRRECLSTTQSRQSTTTDPHLFKNNSGREREKSDSFRASPRASSSRYERYSSASQLSRALENNPFTYINNSKVFNGETPTRLSFEENTDKQTKENTEFISYAGSGLYWIQYITGKLPLACFRSVPITHLFSSPEDQNIKVGLSLTFPKYLQINYEPGFYKEKSLDNFNERIDKILNCVLQYCAENNKIKSKPGVLEKFYKQFKKGVGSVFGSEDIKWWVGEDEAEHIVIVTNNEVIGAIYEKITGQLMDVESASITKFIEFETNQASSSGSSYKRFRIIQESDIKHLGLSENQYHLNNRIW
uniref:Uncharacterized protein n=1 Tax=Meloidogyne floridensis TaxID=298350 RepID=A0A915P7I2_9BILA